MLVMTVRSYAEAAFEYTIQMSRILLNGSPRTAARQLIELLTRDNILDEDGNVRSDTVQAACQYVWQDVRVPEGELYTKPPAATDGSTPTRKKEIPESISEQCTQEESAPPADTSRSNNSAQGASTTDNHDPSLQER